MATGVAGRVGKRGTIVMSAKLRRQFYLEEGAYIIVEACDEGILIRPASLHPVEIYTPERKAQFLLMNAVDAADYADAVTAVRQMGLDPDTIPHDKRPGV